MQKPSLFPLLKLKPAKLNGCTDVKQTPLSFKKCHSEEAEILV